MVWKLQYCCVCVPLRPGLLIWGYLGLVINYITALSILLQMQDILTETGYFNPTTYIKLSLGLGLSFVHFIFYIILLAGMHKRNQELLKTFYGYNMILTIGLSGVMSLYIPLAAHRRDERDSLFILFLVIFTIITILLQLYLSVVVRNYISKLAEDDCTTAVRNSEDPECTLHQFQIQDDEC